MVSTSCRLFISWQMILMLLLLMKRVDSCRLEIINMIHTWALNMNMKERLFLQVSSMERATRLNRLI